MTFPLGRPNDRASSALVVVGASVSACQSFPSICYVERSRIISDCYYHSQLWMTTGIISSTRASQYRLFGESNLMRPISPKFSLRRFKAALSRWRDIVAYGIIAASLAVVISARSEAAITNQVELLGPVALLMLVCVL